eukprot:TRINITY_DN13375_c0_g1_i2.p1 TRINITY_DN13375_c0_g1~~TRINITY_DN13375_c0_g1_i2.p1  ORF type:complete len:190 (-),score=38.18 TRINITY_DN13375_c0_g1_i2:171-740(-)
MAGDDLEKGQNDSSYRSLNGQSSSSCLHHLATLGLFSLLLLALIWLPIWYMGLLQQILAQLMGPVIAMLSIAALFPVLAFGLNELRHRMHDQILESVEHHKEHLKTEVQTVMHNKFELVKDTLEGVVGGSVAEGLQKFEKRVCEMEEKMMKLLGDLPCELKEAVQAEFKSMKKLTEEDLRLGWHQHAKK